MKGANTYRSRDFHKLELCCLPEHKRNVSPTFSAALKACSAPGWAAWQWSALLQPAGIPADCGCEGAVRLARPLV